LLFGGGHTANLPKGGVAHRFRALAHDPEKWIPVFGKDHAQKQKPQAVQL